MINKEIVELKNEFLKEIREVETKLDKKIEKQSLILDTRNKEHEEKINSNIKKNEELYDIMLKEKVQIEKLSELFVSYKKLNDMLMSHEIRINNMLAQNNKLSQNYNKILTDYLSVPGYIGASCQYKTLSEYIQNNIIEMAKLKNQKESEKRVSEDIKSKLDNFMKNMLNLVDNTLTRCNQYTDSKHIFIENMLNSKLVEFREKNMELRTQIFSNFSQTTNEVESFKSQLNELNNLKETITEDIEKKFDEMKSEYEENKHHIKKNMEEIIKYKNSLNELIDRKFEHLSKKQKNINNSNSYYRNEYSKPKKNENVTNIKISRTINKKDEDTNAVKRISTNNNLNNKINEELVKSKIIKRNTAINAEISNKVLVDLKKGKENDKSNLSDEQSSNEENNVKVTNNALKEEDNQIKEDNKEESSNPQLPTEIKNDVDDNKLNDNQNNNDNDKDNVNTNEKNDNDDKKDEEIKIINNDNKENIIDTKHYNTIENTTSVKALDPPYVESTKNKIDQKIKNSDINTIIPKDKNIIIPKLSSILTHEKEKLNINFLTNRNIQSKNTISNVDIKKLKRVETRNVIIKSNTLNHYFQEPKEKELKTIHSDRSIFERHFFKTSQKFNNIQTQTAKIILNNKKKAKFPNIGFSYKVINLGSDIKFRDIQLEKIQELKENAKINVDLSSPLTNTYRAYQKKKKEKNNQLIQSNELILNKRINRSPNRQNVILPSFKTCDSFHRNNNRNIYKSVEKKKRKNTDYEYSLESRSPKSPKAKLMSEIQFK